MKINVLRESFHLFAKYDEGEIWESNTASNYPSFMDADSIQELTGTWTFPDRSYIWMPNDLLD